MPAEVLIRVDGAVIRAPAGISLAAALLNAGIASTRRSLEGEPRGPLCGMGVCFECRVSVDSSEHVRSCLIIVRDGMEVCTGD
jgi:sarcosine oxidase subunit alpha